jgi:hypothetical protein
MALAVKRPRSGGPGKSATIWGFVLSLAGSALAASPGSALEMSAPVEALYTTVSIFPPSAKSMTVCYGFVCRRREILDFTPGDRSALTQILNAGHGSAAAERAAVQKAVVWFDRRMGPVIGTNKRVAKADFRYFDDKHNYDCWAVLLERATKVEWVVDMWPRGYLQPPDVMTVEKWVKED